MGTFLTDWGALLTTGPRQITQRANIHSRNKERRSPLYMAAWENNAPMVQRLLHDNADPNCWDETRRKPLHVAVRAGSWFETAFHGVVRGSYTIRA